MTGFIWLSSVQKLQSSTKKTKSFAEHKKERTEPTEREFRTNQFITKNCSFDKVEMICMSTYSGRNNSKIEWLRVNMFMTDTYEKSESINLIVKVGVMVFCLLLAYLFVPTQ